MRAWLVTNDKSGSNDGDHLREVLEQLAEAGIGVAHHTHFPAEDPPDAERLEQSDIDIVVVFAGDGTLNRIISGLTGWEGALLALPGGTMNLLYHRLFGALKAGEVIRRAAVGKLIRRRPGAIRCSAGIAYAGLLAGPATAWYNVREALRDIDLAAVARGARIALQESFGGEFVRCASPELGRREGYPMLVLQPHNDGIAITAYHAETTPEVLEQLVAVLRRNFRAGPHDHLGEAAELRLASAEGDPFGILLDGEEAQAGAEEDFVLVPAPVDLLASIAHD